MAFWVCQKEKMNTSLLELLPLPEARSYGDYCPDGYTARWFRAIVGRWSQWGGFQQQLDLTDQRSDVGQQLDSLTLHQSPMR
ncbi:hypothetical protein PRBEI_2001837100 [Prionailurus iriomotensis]